MSILTNFAAGAAKRVAGLALPSWAPWAAGALAIAAVVAGSYGMGRVHEARIGAAALAEYKSKQVVQTAKIEVAQAEVKTIVQIKYVDRIKKIYVQGAIIENDIPRYITPADSDRFGVNAGFVRVVDAAWTGEAVGPELSSDRESASISLDDVAAVQVGNATSCRVWREQAYGWRDFYARQQVAINGKAGEWARSAPAGEK